MTFHSKKSDDTRLSRNSGGDQHDELDRLIANAADLRDALPSASKRTNVLEGMKQDYTKPALPSRNGRIAHLLMWCAKNYPGQPITWKDIYKVFRDNERADRSSLEKFEKSGSHVNQILMEKWGRCLVREKGPDGADHGVRASVDDNDTALHSVEKAAQAVVSVHRRWGRVAKIINPMKVRDVRLRKFLTSKPITALSKSAIDTDYLKKLLPPAPVTKGSKGTGSTDDE